jgi:hypothetical protein
MGGDPDSENERKRAAAVAVTGLELAREARGRPVMEIRHDALEEFDIARPLR